ncbi:MAG: dihydropteroate synthase [Acidobacteriota bacterium]|nr:dihydropteroate synthase [Acidobacteriota bacterium]
MRRACTMRARDKQLSLGSRTHIMGVVNATPDSFFDGGRFLEPSQAIDRCLELVESGADILDLGGASSRPGAKPISGEEELDRILPVLEVVRKVVSLPISIDTYRAVVAEEALREGADIINDISAFRFDSELPGIVRRWDAGVILMHMRGTSQTMHRIAPSKDILEEVIADLQIAVDKAMKSGISKGKIMIDPGIGFGKTLENNCKILNQLSRLDSFNLPIVVGTSRKSFIGDLLDLPVQDRLLGSAASVVVSIMRGAHIVRVHDVEEMCQVAQITDAVATEGSLQ